VTRLLKAWVNYDDPSHRRIDRDQYVFVNDSLRPEHFPVRGKGQAEVIYKYLDYDHEPSAEEVLQDVERRGDVRLPDFAETRDYHKANPEERKEAPVISLCGAIKTRDDKRRVAYVYAGERGLFLYWSWINPRWDRRCRFLVVCK